MKTFYNMNSISKIPKFIIVILVSIIIIFLFLKDLENDLSAFVSIFDLIESGFYITIFSAIFLVVDLIIRDRLELFFSSSKRLQSKMYNYCPNCGYKYLVQDKGKFCSNCGTELL
jgi:amino acid transporter